MIPGLHVVIPAGGAGSRLWPLSRSARPKFLLDLTDSGRSLLQQAWDRAVPLCGPEHVTVVTGRTHAGAVAQQLPGLAPGRLVHEPSARDSMAAIGLATRLIHAQEPDAVIASLPADHVITADEAFAAALSQAVVVAGSGAIAAIGITATTASSAYGWIESGASLRLDGARDARRVERFVEKPDPAAAADYLATGRYCWNAGIFVARADVLLGHLADQQPRLSDGLRLAADAWTRGDTGALERVWSTLTRIAVDHAVAEPVAAAGSMAVVPAELGWDDIGDFASLAALLPDRAGVRVLGPADDVQAIDATGLVVTRDGRAVTLLGVEDVVVVDTPDALLVTTREHAQRIRECADRWRAHGRDDLL
ncbi:MAG: sugar phosphate nucleotidyltransferase [Actinomycetota bacterium]|nr:sugar phosphate nucleotidyltransferase [Actinomycetota bacterium]